MQHAQAFGDRDPNAAAVRQLFRDSFRRDIPVDLTVASGDDMFKYSIDVCKGKAIGTMAYFRAGISIFDCIADVARWKFGSLDEVPSFLDFASGHGRFTRVLAAVYPKEKIWAAEILQDAVRFQREQLGVHALQSTTKPEDFAPDRRFDYIYVGSLFTHLPESTFLRWLTKLYSLLTPTGILAFTTHAPDHLPQNVPMPASGIYYLPSTEIPTLHTEDYGATMVTPEYVRNIIERVTHRQEHWYQWHALAFLQDLWIISKAPLPKESFCYDQGPQGHLDYCQWKDPKTIMVCGWTACLSPGHTIEKVEVSLNNELAGVLQVKYNRPDVLERVKHPSSFRCGFLDEVRLPRPADPWTDVLSVVAVCSGGKRYSVRTVPLCSVLEFVPDAVPYSEPERPLTSRDKAHRALDYAIDGDWSVLGKRTLDLLRGR